MKYLLKILFLSALPIFQISCSEEIKNKQEELSEKEQSLLEKEKELALKEAEIQTMVGLQDSLESANDSLTVHPILSQITGKWKGKIVCTESNCQEYVIGDTRMDDWEISEKDGTVIVKNLNKSGTVRVYTGKFDGSTLVVNYTNDPASEKRLDLKISFTTVEPHKLSGTREARVNQSCISKFSIELLR